MDITYLGHSSFKLSGKTATVITDPYDQADVGLKYSGGSAEIVTVSHDHGDHNKIDNVSGKIRIIEGPGEYEVKDVSILGFASYHDNKKGEERGKNTIYIIEIDDLRIAHFGDLGHKLTEKQIEAMGEIDVLLIPVGGHYTIDAEQANEMIKSMDVKIVIPMHYKVDGMKESFKDLEPVETFLSKSNMNSEKLPKLSVKKDDLEEEHKIVVLEKK